MLRSAPTRVLGDRDLAAARQVLAQDPVANVFVASRLAAAGLEPARLGAEVWGFWRGSELVSLCYSGANLAPVQADDEAVHVFAERARRQGRRCSSIVGPAEAVLALWHELVPVWQPARDVRDDQPLLVLRDPPRVSPDPQVRRVTQGEVDLLFPAAVAMFTAEVGVSPVGSDGGALYRTRVSDLVRESRAFARIEDGAVVYKADIGAATPQACQIQGVWTAPERRGAGLGTAGTAAVAAMALRDVAPVVSLYVNSFNLAARRTYDRIGFVQEGTIASVLF